MNTQQPATDPTPYDAMRLFAVWLLEELEEHSCPSIALFRQRLADIEAEAAARDPEVDEASVLRNRYGGLVAMLDAATERGLTVHVATRATCAEHIEHGDDKAAEPLALAASPEPAEGLDVDRLQTASDTVWERLRGMELRPTSTYIRELVAEYARLQQQTEERP